MISKIIGMHSQIDLPHSTDDELGNKKMTNSNVHDLPMGPHICQKCNSTTIINVEYAEMRLRQTDFLNLGAQPHVLLCRMGEGYILKFKHQQGHDNDITLCQVKNCCSSSMGGNEKSNLFRPSMLTWW